MRNIEHACSFPYPQFKCGEDKAGTSSKWCVFFPDVSERNAHKQAPSPFLTRQSSICIYTKAPGLIAVPLVNDQNTGALRCIQARPVLSTCTCLMFPLSPHNSKDAGLRHRKRNQTLSPWMREGGKKKEREKRRGIKIKLCKMLM